MVIVILHWGIEWSHLEHPEQVAIAHQMIDAGAKIIIGHHSHLAGAYERYRNGHIFYGLGNLYMNLPQFSGSRASTRPLVKVGFQGREIESVGILPIINDDRGLPLIIGQSESIKSFNIDYIPEKLDLKHKPAFDSYPLLRDFVVTGSIRDNNIEGVWDNEFIISDNLIEGKMPLGPGWRCSKESWIGLSYSRELINNEFLNTHTAYFDRPGVIEARITLRNKVRKVLIASGVIPGFRHLDQSIDLRLEIAINKRVGLKFNQTDISKEWEIREFTPEETPSFPAEMTIRIDNKASGVSCFNFRIWGA